MNAWISRAGLLLVVLLCISFCLTELAEVDLHWHLRAGERILGEGRVPRADDFTYTSAGRPWIDLHWLFQAAVAAAYRAAGWEGLDLLKIGCVAGAFLLALRAAARRGARPAVLAPLALAAVIASQERFTLRPEVVSFLLLSVLLVLLEERRRNPLWLGLLPPLFALWANGHALYVVGLAVLCLTAAGDFIESPRPRPAPAAGPRAAPAALLPGAALLSIAATAMTPFGFTGWVLPWRLLFERIASDNVYARNIAEFQSPFGGYGPTASIAAFALLVTVVIAGLIFGRRAARPADVLGLGALLILALLARRNIPFFSLAALAWAGPPLQAAWSGVAQRFCAAATGKGGAWPRRAAHAGGAGILLAAAFLLTDVWSNRFYERDGTQRYFGRGPAPGFYPEGAAAFILRESPRGEVIHDLTMGGYLAWRWHPARRTFIDGRLEVHDESLFRTYLGLERDPALFEATARRLGVHTVLWSHRHSPEASALLRHLAGGPGWRPVYVDMSASVFVRSAQGDEAPGPGTIDLSDPGLGSRILEEVRRAEEEAARKDPAPAFLRRFLPRRPVPVATVNAALFFGIAGSPVVAETLFRAALQRAPGNAILHYDLGLVLERTGRGGEARAEFEAALRVDPSLGPAREGLALRLLKEGDPEGALRQWTAAERSGPLSEASLLARGGLMARQGRIDDAIEDYRRAVDRDPRNARLRADLALLYHRRGLGRQAAAEIRRALSIEPRGCAPRVALGQIYASDGRRDEAEKIYREAIAQSGAPCPEAEQALQELLWGIPSADRQE
ncbi:MAG: tetratricopeptide repeat protein [Acidobacteria bacterium]|nr:tetratricopeptide repeat protein [Acidobacteriota bacterium]